MTKIDVFSGFLGAGKTTLIKKLLREALSDEKVVLIENEFGEIGIDGGFLKEAGVEITEMNSGCICCSLVGDFEKALLEVLTRFHPDRVLIEPSGVGKLSDVVNAVRGVLSETVTLGSLITVADASKCKVYMKNFGEFYNNQLAHAGAIILSRTDGMSEDKLAAAVALLRECNNEAVIVTTPWEQLDGKQLLAAVEGRHTLAKEMEMLEKEHHHHHDHENGEECDCHHHHHHESDKECDCHHHEHDEECHCHDHEHHHHEHHHHADEVFSSFGRETAKRYSEESLRAALEAIEAGECGTVLRAKGILSGEGGKWLHFDYVPGEISVREGAADVIGRLCVIGAELDEAALSRLFGL